MAEITKVYKQSIPATRFIGKKYGDDDRVNGMFGHLWEEWWTADYWQTIKANVDGELADYFENGDATIGLMTCENGSFQYWIGFYTPANTPVPDGFQSIDFPAKNLGVAWVTGQEPDIYMKEELCAQHLAEAGIIINDNWCFERYVEDHFDKPDENGNITLDICYFVE